MKKLNLTVFIILLSAAALAAEVPPGFSGWALVTAVDDGDSFTADINGVSAEVRMLYIDAPEKDQPFGDVAGRYLTGLILHQRVYLKCKARDVYARYLCQVRLHGQDLAPVLVGAGPGLGISQIGAAFSCRRQGPKDGPVGA